jgi:hypothetical protein
LMAWHEDLLLLLGWGLVGSRSRRIDRISSCCCCMPACLLLRLRALLLLQQAACCCSHVHLEIC